MSKIGLSISMIGGILFFTLTYFFYRNYYSLWLLGEEALLLYLFYLFINGGAIVGALLGFVDKKIGYYLCLLTGISFPLFLLYFYLSNPSTFFIGFFESLIETFYISLPELILFIGGITGMIEWQLELRKNKFAQE